MTKEEIQDIRYMMEQVYYVPHFKGIEIEALVIALEQAQAELEQAKRAGVKAVEMIGELQMEIDRLKITHSRSEYERIFADKERYRQALEEIIGESICQGIDCKWGDTCYAVIARKALEGLE